MLFDALIYYEKCGDEDGLWNTLLRISAARHSRAEAQWFIQLIDRLSETFRQKTPMTRIVLAVLLANNLHFPRALKELDAVQSELEAQKKCARRDSLLGECFAARGLITLAMEKNGFEAYFEKAAALLPDGSSRWNDRILLVDMGPGLNLYSAKKGALEESLACFIHGVPYIVQVLHGAGQGLDSLARCEAAFLTGSLKEAERYAFKALYEAQAGRQHDIVGNALFMLLRIYNIGGDYKNLLQILEKIQLAEQEEGAQRLGIWDVARGWFFSEIGETAQVAGWILNGTNSGQPPISMDRELLVRARCLIATGQDGEALALLDYYEAAVKKKQAVIARLYIEICRGVANLRLHDEPAAFACLKEAYSLAAENNLVTPFIEYGNRTRTLLIHARQAGTLEIPAEWLGMVYAKAGTYAKRHLYLTEQYQKDHKGEEREYGLTQRETELLRNLSQGLTREEIADSMDLSLNTVKSMLKQVFGKLGAINSADAVRIAIQAGLI